MTELYVYYRLDACAVEAARVQVEAAQAALRRQIAGLQTALLRRADATADVATDAADGRPATDPPPATWMEIYRRPGGLDEAACAAIETTLRDLPPARVGARIVERFELLTPIMPSALGAPGPRPGPGRLS